MTALTHRAIFVPDRRPGRYLIAFVQILAALFLLSGGATAQSSQSSSLVLRDDSPVIDLAPYLSVMRDPDKSMTFKTVYERYASGWRGDSLSGDVVVLGAAEIPHWMVFGVYNQSWTDKWVLSFGQHMTGRIGQIKQIILFDQISGATYLNNSRPAEDNPYIVGSQGSTSVSLTIPRGKQALLLMYVTPQPGMTATLAPVLMTEQAYGQLSGSPLHPARLMNFFFAAMFGFFIAVMLFLRYWGAGFFLLYYAAQIAFFNYQDDVLYSASSWSGDVGGMMMVGATVAALLSAWSFLNTGTLSSLQTRMIVAFALANIGAGVAGSLVFHGAALYNFVIYGPIILTYLFLTMLSLAQGFTGRPGAYALATAWLFSFLGVSSAFLEALNLLPAKTWLLAGGWYALVPQGAALIAASLLRGMASEYESIQKENDEAGDGDKVAQLKQSKEASENQRLKRLIEHERQVMTELRERESKQNDDMRKAMAAADDANRAKSAFLAVISHEIRTPMSGILGMVRLLLETTLNTNQRDYAQTIQDSGDAMLSLLNDILDFEKIESGKMDLEHIDFELPRLIQGISTLMSGHAANKRIYLKVEIDEKLPRFVVGDPVRLRQVLLNLTGNSIKFTSQGGVTLRVRQENPGAEDKAAAASRTHRIKFSVEDTGVGISAEGQKNLFNPFAQADSSVARKFGGTGLGLAISQRLIEAMGGKIKIDSTEGRGSTFYFLLSMDEGNADALKDRQAATQVSSQKSEKSLDILIVDDNEINQKLLREFVDRMGHKTSLAGSGEDALQLMKSKKLDMILMDIELPGLSGMGTTKAIRALADRKAAATPVIALTGNVREEDIRQCFAANMNGHLAKPVDPKRLKQMIDKVIKGQLDNPVELAEVATSSEYAGINKVGGAKPRPAAPPPSAVPVPPPMPVLPGQQQTPAMPPLAATPRTPAATMPPGPSVRGTPLAAKGTGEPSAIAAAKAMGDDAALPGQPSKGADKAPIHALAMSMENDLKPPLDEKKEGAPPVAVAAPAPVAYAAANVFDQAMLGDLRKSIAGPQFDDLIRGLFDKTDEIVDALAAAAANGDQKAMTQRAHELKGMAANFGLKELSGMAAEAEKALKENRTEGIGNLLSVLPAANQRAKEALNTWMKA